MTTGRINQVAALRRTGPPEGPSRSNNQSTAPCGAGSRLVRKVSIAMLWADPRPPRRRAWGRRLFLESPLSVPPPNSNESEATPPRGVGTPARGGLPAGVGAAPASRGGQGRTNPPSSPQPFWQPAIWYACTSCIGTSSPSTTAPWPHSSRGAVLTPPTISSRWQALNKGEGWAIHLPQTAAGGLATPHPTVPHRTTGSPEPFSGPGPRSPVSRSGYLPRAPLFRAPDWAGLPT
jgi:hypothetical protein